MDRSEPQTEEWTERIAQFAQNARSCAISWRPQVTGFTSKESLACCFRNGAAGVVTSSLTELLRVGDLPSDHLSAPTHLVSLPLSASSVSLLGQRSLAAGVLPVVDHFVHAERISILCGDQVQDQAVLILLQGDQAGPGIRPGQDALQLAQGIRRLPGLRVAGITVSVEESQTATAVLRAAEHTQQLFRKSGIGCEITNVMADADLLLDDWEGITDAGITDIGVRGLVAGVDSPVSFGRRTAEVISRPSLDVVVIGLESLPEEVEVAVRLTDHPQAGLLSRRYGCCVFSADGSARQLTIGDSVQVEMTATWHHQAIGPE